MERNITRLDAFTYRERIEGGDATVLIPVGALEQHGPHMPLYTDAMLSTKMAELTAESTDSLVGPTIWTGYKSQQRSGGGNHIIGSFGFDAAHVIETCRTLVREFTRHGVQRIAFINGHYENYQFIYEGVDLAIRDIASAGENLPTVLLLVLGFCHRRDDHGALPRWIPWLGRRARRCHGNLNHARVLPRTCPDG